MDYPQVDHLISKSRFSMRPVQPELLQGNPPRRIPDISLHRNHCGISDVDGTRVAVLRGARGFVEERC